MNTLNTTTLMIFSFGGISPKKIIYFSLIVPGRFPIGVRLRTRLALGLALRLVALGPVAVEDG